MNWNVLVGAVCSIGGFAVAYLVFLRNKQKDSEEDGNRSGTIMTEIGCIKQILSEIKDELVEQRRTNQEMLSRLVKVEESAKQAHKRIDELSGRLE